MRAARRRSPSTIRKRARASVGPRRARRARRSSRADCAMTAGASLPSGNIAACELPRLLGVEQHAAFARERRDAARRRPASTAITLFSDEQLVALSNVFERAILRRGVGDVGGLVDDHRDVAGADADRRRAALVRGAHVGLRAGRDDEIGLPHQLERVLARRPAPAAAARDRAARRRGRAPRARTASSSASVDAPFGDGASDDRVAALQRVDDVVRRRRAGIGRRRDRGDDADRTRDLDQAARRGPRR